MTEYYKPAGCPVHGDVRLSNNDIQLPKFGIDQKRFNEIAKKVETQYTASQPIIISEELFDYTNNHLQKAITQVFGNPKYDDNNFAFVQKLRRNATRFAGFKTAAQTRTIQKSKPERYPLINNAYNNNWLRTEYVYTVRSARSGEKWQKYMRDADIYPYLEYMPSSSAVRRSEHVKLYGIIKHLNDNFWDTWLPPSDWGCKCSVQQRRTDKNSNPVPDDITLPKKNMRNNPGKTGQIFTDEHPMIKAVSAERKEKIEKFLFKIERNNIKIWAKKHYVNSNKTIKHSELDKNITFSNNGIKEMLNQPHKHIVEKNDAIYNIEQLMKKAIYKGITQYKNRISHIFEIKINNKNSYIIVNEYKGKGLIFYSISDSNKVLKGIKKPK